MHHKQHTIRTKIVNSLRWMLIISLLATIIGLIVAFFLWMLDEATATRIKYIWLPLFLPIAGVFISFIYKYWGKKASEGNNLILAAIKSENIYVPFIMTPLILFTTIITHLFGGSAGREGTAVQMGGSIAAWIGRQFNLSIEDRKTLLMCGISAGFGAVFGTPLAGTVFALEVLRRGQIIHKSILQYLLASVLADKVCSYTGIVHTKYAIKTITEINPSLLIKTIMVGIICGIVAYFFIHLSKFIKQQSKAIIKNDLLIPIIGGILVILISYLLGTFDYLGLGVTASNIKGISIINAFVSSGGTETYSWFWKLLLTAITLNMGFKGGEVTPLFFIGATLGNTLAVLFNVPVDLFSGLGFIAVFAAATNTPIASIIMGIELFGIENGIYYAIVCMMAYYASGYASIYEVQIKDEEENKERGI